MPSPTRRSRTWSRSGGLNLGLDFLPGALTFNPGGSARRSIPRRRGRRLAGRIHHQPGPDHGQPEPARLARPTWLIDHGAALYIHHTWREPDAHARRPFERLPTTSCCPWRARSWRRTTGSRDARRPRPSRRSSRRSRTRGSPDHPVAGDADAQRRLYVGYLRRRLDRASPVHRGGRACPRRRLALPVRDNPCRATRGARRAAQRRGRLLCRGKRYLGARVALDEARLARLPRTSTWPRCAPISTPSNGSPRATRRQGRSPGWARRTVPLAGPAVSDHDPAVGGPYRVQRRPAPGARGPRWRSWSTSPARSVS